MRSEASEVAGDPGLILQMIPDSEWAKSLSKEESWTRGAENNQRYLLSPLHKRTSLKNRGERGKQGANFDQPL